jgi:hypothetical protein
MNNNWVCCTYWGCAVISLISRWIKIQCTVDFTWESVLFFTHRHRHSSLVKVTVLRFFVTVNKICFNNLWGNKLTNAFYVWNALNPTRFAPIRYFKGIWDSKWAFWALGKVTRTREPLKTLSAIFYYMLLCEKAFFSGLSEQENITEYYSYNG